MLVVEFAHATGSKIEHGVGVGVAHGFVEPEDDASAHEVADTEAPGDVGQKAACPLPG